MTPSLDSAARVRPGEELDLAVLNAYLRPLGVHEIKGVRQFPGGFSNLTYLLETASGAAFVLRRPPFGAQVKGGHDMGREFRVLTALRGAGYEKVPAPVAFCEDETVLGAPFYVMERVPGVILRAADARSLNAPPEMMRTLCENLVDTLADLHSLDLTTTDLGTLGKPEGYVPRQVEGWIGRYERSQTDDVPAMSELAAWLRQNLPPEQAPAFLHNDFKFDNVVLDPEISTEIRAVLDWEMATVGDPLMDLGATLAYWCEPGDPDFLKAFNLTHLSGCLTRREVVQRYAARTGRDVSAIGFYYAFGLYKNAVIIQQIYARWKAGLTRDPRFGSLLPGVFELGRMGVTAGEEI
ncbi:MAG: phosphotransferase family protein [Sphingobacteriaceae bacterium]|nr:phosphotransferase family protein [Cytophagaceae bacterium]